MFNRCYGCMQPLSFPDAPCPHCGYDGRAQIFDRNHLQPGTVLQNRYVLGTALGLGGFGNTYIGWDPQTQMRVTVKEYLPSAFAYHRADTAAVQLHAPEYRGLFAKGLQSFCSQSAALQHITDAECINPILDIVQENGTVYTVMEYLSGQTLKAYLSEYRAIPFDHAMDVMAPILRTLEAVHQNGLLHRDVCPDNIFLCNNGQVRILDFGLAQYELMPADSESLSVLFKPGFTPPEQYVRHLVAGPWTDVFGAAATLYKMITGIAPPDVPQRKREDRLLPPHELECDIPQTAEHALLRALSLRPEDRYATADAFLRALDDANVDDDEPQPQPLLRRLLKPLLIVLLVLTVGIGAAAWITHRPHVTNAPSASTEPQTAPYDPEVELPDGADVVYIDGFAPAAMEPVRTQNGDAAVVPYAVFVEDGRRGLVTQTGETALPAQYDTIVWDSARRAFLLDGGTYWTEAHETEAAPAMPESSAQTETAAYTYDLGTGKIRLPDGASYTPTGTTGGYLLLSDGKYGVVTGGTTLIEPTYAKATAFSCGIASFLESGQWTYRNLYGVDILGRSFDASVFPNGVPFSYSDGYVPVFDDETGLWGFADTAGKICIAPQYLTALPPVQGAAWVQTENGYGLLRFAATAEDAIGGKCGENVQFTFNKQTGQLEISGFGEMWNFTAETVPWLSFSSSIRTVRIEGDVSSIGAGSFAGCTALTGVTVTSLPSEIGPAAFALCGNLHILSVSDTLVQIDDAAFFGCAALTDLPIQSVRSIGAYAFCASGLQRLLAQNAETVGQCAFAQCANLQSADLSAALRLADAAFSGCPALETLTLTGRMESIGTRAFDGCASLEGVLIPPGLSEIAPQTFRGCASLTTVTLPDGLKSIGQEAFADCASLNGVSLPPTLNTIGTRAFSGCAAMQSVMVPTSVSVIGDYAFAGCTGITAFELQDTVKSLGAYVFSGWTSQQTIRIKNVLLKRLFGEPTGWDENWKAGCSAQIVSV